MGDRVFPQRYSAEGGESDLQTCDGARGDMPCL